jgi:N-ethylmaleimide reductase
MNLFSPLRLGALELRNRIIMAPMTRGRADKNAVPTAEMVDYYRQRASAGLIISEGIAPSAEGLGYCRTPGLFNDYQTSAWRQVTAAVHGEGGLIAAQIMHVGRVASHYNKPADSDTVSPSALTARGEMYTDEKGMQPFDSPRALQFDEISRVIADYQRATENAFAAGFDAVELHCTSGYLPAQFLSSGTNQRTDAYGGSVENRVRFVLEVLDAMASVRGSDRVGIRICPDNPFNDLLDEDPEQTFDTLLKEASGRGLAYLHSIRMPAGRVDNIGLGQRYFGDCLIANESYSFEEAQSQVESAAVTAVSFGRPFIANPDLVARWQNNIALANFDPGTLYTPGSAGYSDYPSAHA